MGRKRQSKTERIKIMESYPFKCTVKASGIKCVYRALYHSEIKAHITKHQNSIDSGVPTRARSYEVADETAATENSIETDQSQDQQLAFDDPAAVRVAIFGPQNECVYVPLESILNEVDKKFEEEFVLYEDPSEMLVNERDEYSAKSSPLIPQQSLVFGKKQLKVQFNQIDEFDDEHQTGEGSHILPLVLQHESVQLESTEPNTTPASGEYTTSFLSRFLSLFNVVFQFV